MSEPPVLAACGFTPAPLPEFSPFDALHVGPEIDGRPVEVHTWTLPGYPPVFDVAHAYFTPLGGVALAYRALTLAELSERLPAILTHLRAIREVPTCPAS